MTLQDYQVRSAYMLKPRLGIKRFTPEDFNDRGNRTVGGCSRMADLDDEVEEEEEEAPQPVAPSRRRKIATKRGRGGKNTRGRN